MRVPLELEPRRSQSGKDGDRIVGSEIMLEREC
jgi:hypothetical protein